jgi:hypothetical protein
MLHRHANRKSLSRGFAEGKGNGGKRFYSKAVSGLGREPLSCFDSMPEVQWPQLNTGWHMRKSASLLLLSALIVLTPAIAQDWEQKPYNAWNPKDVTKVLTESPWVSLRQCFHCLRGYDEHTDFYRIRLLTAAPIRHAYLRYITFVPDSRQLGVDLRDLVEESTGNRAQSLYNRFVKNNPDDIRLVGSDQFIVVSINATDWGWGSSWPPMLEYSLPEAFFDLKLSDLEGKAFLSTNSSQKIQVARYDRPIWDSLGAKLWFPRHLPSGKDWISPRDTKLRFSLDIPGTKISATFDLRKLMYRGKLEL